MLGGSGGNIWNWIFVLLLIGAICLLLFGLPLLLIGRMTRKAATEETNKPAVFSKVWGFLSITLTLLAFAFVLLDKKNHSMESLYLACGGWLAALVFNLVALAARKNYQLSIGCMVCLLGWVYIKFQA